MKKHAVIGSVLQTVLVLGALSWTFCARPAFGADSSSDADLKKRVKELEERLSSIEALANQAEKDAEEARKEIEETRDTHERVQLSPDVDLPEWITQGFEFIGYMRCGFGVNGRGGRQEAFKAPGADAKYRLGNETDTYCEAAFAQEFGYDSRDTPVFRVQLRLSYSINSGVQASEHDDKLALRESYVEAKGFTWSGDSVFWAGQRFYRRHDIHINDFYIFDMSGYGGGVEDIPLGAGDLKAAIAYLGGSTDDYQFPRAGRVAKNTLDMRIYGIPLPAGEGTLWVAPSSLKGGSYTTEDESGKDVTSTYETCSGVAVGAIHLHELKGEGYNEITVQYGVGPAYDFSPVVHEPGDSLDDAWRFRATESIVLGEGRPLCVMGDVVWQVTDNGADSDSRINWLSSGVRPIYQFTDHVAMAFEAGLDWVDNEPEDCSGVLYKLTLAPELRVGRGFFDRPVIRTYVTYAGWGNEFEGKVGGDAYADAQTGIAAGIQAEAWW